MLGTFGAYKYKPAAFIVLAKSLGGKEGCSCADERLYVVSPLFLYLTVTFLCHVESPCDNFCVFLCARDSWSLFGQRVSSGIYRLLLSSLIDN